MQSQNQTEKIAKFLSLVSPIVVQLVEATLQSFGWQVKHENNGLDLAFSIKAGEKEIQFYLRNLLLEIATVDRDQEPLRFDENLRDVDFFLTKTARLVQSKLEILLHLLREKDIDAAVENISRDAKQYERIRIWRFDQEKPAQDHQL